MITAASALVISAAGSPSLKIFSSFTTSFSFSSDGGDAMPRTPAPVQSTSLAPVPSAAPIDYSPCDSVSIEVLPFEFNRAGSSAPPSPDMGEGDKLKYFNCTEMCDLPAPMQREHQISMQ